MYLKWANLSGCKLRIGRFVKPRLRIGSLLSPESGVGGTEAILNEEKAIVLTVCD